MRDCIGIPPFRTCPYLAGPAPFDPLIGHAHDSPYCERCERQRRNSLAAPPRRTRSVGRGGRVAGEHHPKATLSDVDVRRMRTMYATGRETTRSIAEKFGVPQRTAHSILSGRTRWSA